ncbi:uncharacterized protein BXIN_2799 [Babesia sp. Xinjiang]|uniref:uncharacterized protein n=1 Tax=Babesia sp. Xinjiang TaxID=462227 RepID=UPI000A233460|nr:uncharacterized protein BXIN_2799 [Babesia sp. Xinjiang]ORM41727.1 hypothetical protein BXIN_2799 [Babesia sp. Xinjiang]
MYTSPKVIRMTLDEYLARPKENDVLYDDIIIVPPRKPRPAGRGRTAAHFERLKKISMESMDTDPRFKIKEDELRYFKDMKDKLGKRIRQPSSEEKCALLKHCFYTLRGYSQAEPTTGVLENLGESERAKLFGSEPPEAIDLARAGISFATLHRLLHELANYMCDGKGKNIHESSSMWLFVILILLDDLHAIMESNSYELQRIKRALSRHVPAMIKDMTIYDTQDADDRLACEKAERAISGFISNIGIIRQHFNQM